VREQQGVRRSSPMGGIASAGLLWFESGCGTAKRAELDSLAGWLTSEGERGAGWPEMRRSRVLAEDARGRP
jgi:hypothetical protein